MFEYLPARRPIVWNVLITLLVLLCVWAFYSIDSIDGRFIVGCIAGMLPLAMTNVRWTLGVIALALVVSLVAGATLTRAQSSYEDFIYKGDDEPAPRMESRQDYWRRMEQDTRLRRMERELDDLRVEQEMQRSRAWMLERQRTPYR